MKFIGSIIESWDYNEIKNNEFEEKLCLDQMPAPELVIGIGRYEKKLIGRTLETNTRL